MPFPRNALEGVFAAVGELEAGTHHEIRDGARDEHFAGLRERNDAGRDVHRDATELVIALFAFAGVHAGAHFETEAPDRGGCGESAVHRASGTIERDEEPVAGGFHFLAAVALELTAHDLVVAVEQFTPTLVTELGCPSRGVDDVGVQDRGQNPVGTRLGSMPGQEILDLVDESVDIPGEDETVVARKLDELRPRDLRGEVTALVYRDERIIDAVEHEGRDPDGR